MAFVCLSLRFTFLRPATNCPTPVMHMYKHPHWSLTLESTSHTPAPCLPLIEYRYYQNRMPSGLWEWGITPFALSNTLATVFYLHLFLSEKRWEREGEPNGVREPFFCLGLWKSVVPSKSTIKRNDGFVNFEPDFFLHAFLFLKQIIEKLDLSLFPICYFCHCLKRR